MGAAGIEESGMIKESTDTKNDAIFGPGVYLTSMSPSNSTEKIILNNYDDRVGIVDRPTVRAKVQYAVEVQVDSNEVEKVSDDRDVYLYSGDLDLNKHEHKIQKKH
ncbi:unnamed protein product [Porites lobata]|uniref:Uncharacterized protein n=1 Tax=Porites lobata TaxID=104759 RepID=A0ABN8PUF4_9CNID|nr:unnamed protein product [Porites lobata]